MDAYVRVKSSGNINARKHKYSALERIHFMKIPLGFYGFKTLNRFILIERNCNVSTPLSSGTFCIKAVVINASVANALGNAMK